MCGGIVRKSSNTKKPSIKGLTIHQPFPELILRKRKHVEIRSWRTLQGASPDSRGNEDGFRVCEGIRFES
jgi:hypothetical protein